MNTESQKKSITIVNMNELDMISNDVKEIFDDTELDIGRALTKMAEAFGSSASLAQVHDIYTRYKLPKRIVDGKEYVAGYKGSGRVQDGWYDATLIDVKQSGKECKLMFAVQENKFLYQTLDEFTLNEVVVYAKSIGSAYKVLVITEKIPATGDLHSIINKSEKS